jgi:hypothetical protein
MPFMDTVLPVSAMHEKMEDRAQEEERPGKDAQDVRLVFIPEK